MLYKRMTRHGITYVATLWRGWFYLNSLMGVLPTLMYLWPSPGLITMLSTTAEIVGACMQKPWWMISMHQMLKSRWSIYPLGCPNTWSMLAPLPRGCWRKSLQDHLCIVGRTVISAKHTVHQLSVNLWEYNAKLLLFFVEHSFTRWSLPDYILY